jgi:hypothetical protein
MASSTYSNTFAVPTSCDFYHHLGAGCKEVSVLLHRSSPPGVLSHHIGIGNAGLFCYGPNRRASSEHSSFQGILRAFHSVMCFLLET